MELEIVKKKFEVACSGATSLQIASNFGAAFEAVILVKNLRDLLTDEVIKEVFMPLMNTRIGFLTDRSGKPNKNGTVMPLYSVSEVRDCLIDGIGMGLLPTGNQMNIISGRAYPTKEGYTALLKRENVKYLINVGVDKNVSQDYAEVPVVINYEHNGEKKSMQTAVTVKKDSYSFMDQIKGKAERRAKKVLYEYITGTDFGDGDEAITPHEEISSKPAPKGGAQTGGVVGSPALKQATPDPLRQPDEAPF